MGLNSMDRMGLKWYFGVPRGHWSGNRPSAAMTPARANVPYVCPHTLTGEEAYQVNKIKELLVDQRGESIMFKSIKKPEWLGVAEPPYKFYQVRDLNHRINQLSLEIFSNFMNMGFWYNMGCKDIKNFFVWAHAKVVTTAAQRVFLEQLQTFGASARLGTVAPVIYYYRVLVRLLFYYASQHGDMIAVNMAFHKYLWRPTWPVVRVLLLGAARIRGKQTGTSCPLVALPMITRTGWGGRSPVPAGVARARRGGEDQKVGRTFWAQFFFPKIFFGICYKSFLNFPCSPPLLFYAISYKILYYSTFW